jgi:hypothetical protein
MPKVTSSKEILMKNQLSISQQMKAVVLSILIAFSLTACARSTPTDAQIDAQYNKLLVEYNNAELYKASTKSVCHKAIYIKKAEHVSSICFKNLDDVPDELLNQASLPYLKKHVEPAYLDKLIQFYSQDKVKKIAYRAVTDPYSTSQDENDIYYAMDYTPEGRQFIKYIGDIELTDNLDDVSIKYLQEHKAVK